MLEDPCHALVETLAFRLASQAALSVYSISCLGMKAEKYPLAYLVFVAYIDQDLENVCKANHKRDQLADRADVVNAGNMVPFEHKLYADD